MASSSSSCNGRVLIRRRRQRPFVEGEDVLLDGDDGKVYLGVVVEVDEVVGQCLIRFGDCTEKWSSANSLRRLDGDDDMEEYFEEEDDDEDDDVEVEDEEDVIEIVSDDEDDLPLKRIKQSSSSSKRALRPPKPPKPPAKPAQLKKTPKVRGRPGPRKQPPAVGPVLIEPPPSHVADARKELPYDFDSLVWDSSHQRNESENYCYCGESGDWYKKMFQCNKCLQWFHQECLRKSTPQVLFGDRFFDFVCGLCTGKVEEAIKRLDLTWVEALHLVLFNLTVVNNKKYHDLETSILPFFKRKWKCLQGPGTLLKAARIEAEFMNRLLCGNKTRFKCGSEIKKRSTFWGLRKVSPPAVPNKYGLNMCQTVYGPIEGSTSSGGGINYKCKLETKQQRLKRQLSGSNHKQSLSSKKTPMEAPPLEAAAPKKPPTAKKRGRPPRLLKPAAISLASSVASSAASPASTSRQNSLETSEVSEEEVDVAVKQSSAAPSAAVSFGGCSLDTFIPPPKNFEGCNNPFRSLGILGGENSATPFDSPQAPPNAELGAPLLGQPEKQQASPEKLMNYFGGAETRLIRGERFGVAARRLTLDGDVQFLIEWEQPGPLSPPLGTTASGVTTSIKLLSDDEGVAAQKRAESVLSSPEKATTSEASSPPYDCVTSPKKSATDKEKKRPLWKPVLGGIENPALETKGVSALALAAGVAKPPSVSSSTTCSTVTSPARIESRGPCSMTNSNQNDAQSNVSGDSSSKLYSKPRSKNDGEGAKTTLVKSLVPEPRTNPPSAATTSPSLVNSVPSTVESTSLKSTSVISIFPVVTTKDTFGNSLSDRDGKNPIVPVTTSSSSTSQQMTKISKTEASKLQTGIDKFPHTVKSTNESTSNTGCMGNVTPTSSNQANNGTRESSCLQRNSPMSHRGQDGGSDKCSIHDKSPGSSSGINKNDPLGKSLRESSTSMLSDKRSSSVIKPNTSQEQKSVSEEQCLKTVSMGGSSTAVPTTSGEFEIMLCRSVESVKDENSTVLATSSVTSSSLNTPKEPSVTSTAHTSSSLGGSDSGFVSDDADKKHEKDTPLPEVIKVSDNSGGSIGTYESDMVEDQEFDLVIDDCLEEDAVLVNGIAERDDIIDSVQVKEGVQKKNDICKVDNEVGKIRWDEYLKESVQNSSQDKSKNVEAEISPIPIIAIDLPITANGFGSKKEDSKKRKIDAVNRDDQCNETIKRAKMEKLSDLDAEKTTPKGAMTLEKSSEVMKHDLKLVEGRPEVASQKDHPAAGKISTLKTILIDRNGHPKSDIKTTGPDGINTPSGESFAGSKDLSEVSSQEMTTPEQSFVHKLTSVDSSKDLAKDRPNSSDTELEISVVMNTSSGKDARRGSLGASLESGVESGISDERLKRKSGLLGKEKEGTEPSPNIEASKEAKVLSETVSNAPGKEISEARQTNVDSPGDFSSISAGDEGTNPEDKTKESNQSKDQTHPEFNDEVADPAGLPSEADVVGEKLVEFHKSSFSEGDRNSKSKFATSEVTPVVEKEVGSQDASGVTAKEKRSELETEVTSLGDDEADEPLKSKQTTRSDASSACTASVPKSENLNNNKASKSDDDEVELIDLTEETQGAVAKLAAVAQTATSVETMTMTAAAAAATATATATATAVAVATATTAAAAMEMTTTTTMTTATTTTLDSKSLNSEDKELHKSGKSKDESDGNTAANNHTMNEASVVVNRCSTESLISPRNCKRAPFVVLTKLEEDETVNKSLPSSVIMFQLCKANSVVKKQQ